MEKDRRTGKSKGERKEVIAADVHVGWKSKSEETLHMPTPLKRKRRARGWAIGGRKII